jgi:hypothetical protein
MVMVVGSIAPVDSGGCVRHRTCTILSLLYGKEELMPTEALLDTFTFTVEEKVGLKDYSNILVRASISRQIPDDDEARQKVIDQVEAVLVRERNIVLEDLGIEVKS